MHLFRLECLKDRLIDLASENYFGLDASGCEILKFLENGKTLQEAQDSLLEMYDVDPEVLAKDLVDFVKKLMAAGLVKSA